MSTEPSTPVQDHGRSILSRHSYIGGSSAATVLGRNEYETRYDLWNRKVHEIDIDLSKNRHVLRGNLVEPVIEDYVREHLDPTINDENAWQRHDYGTAERRFGVRAADAQIMLMGKELSPVHGLPYIGGHPDGVGAEILWEFKAPTPRKLDLVIKSGPPPAWLYQVQHYLMLSGLPKGCLAIWSFDRWEPYLIWVDPDPYLHEMMRREYAQFWEHVERGTPPPEDALTRREREHHTVVTDPQLDALLADYQDAYEARYAAADKQDEARMRLLAALGGRQTVMTPNFRVQVTEAARFGKPYTRLTVRRADRSEPEKILGDEGEMA